MEGRASTGGEKTYSWVLAASHLIAKMLRACALKKDQAVAWGLRWAWFYPPVVGASCRVNEPTIMLAVILTYVDLVAINRTNRIALLLITNGAGGNAVDAGLARVSK